MDFRVLRASATFDAQTWDSLIAALPVERRDLHFTSSYGRVQEKLGGEAVLAALVQDDTFILQPFIVRPTPYDSKRFDLCSPYGYGGPVSNSERFMASWAKAFESRLSEWCVEQNIVSEFCYLHPLMVEHQHRLLTVKSHIIKDVVVMDLANLSEDSLARRVRRGLHKARSGNVMAVQLQDQPIARARFAAMYERSMERKSATNRWRFSREYLEAHFDQLAARLFYVTDDEGGSRILMVVGGYGTAYAHLLGSNGLSQRSGLDEMLYCYAARVLREQGYERFHLGGGLTGKPDDPLLAFKSGFSKQHYKLYSYTRVFDERAYNELSERKMADECSQLGHTIESSFFPVYRREASA